MRRLFVLAFILAVTLCKSVAAETVSKAEQRSAEAWSQSCGTPFSFVYEGKLSAVLLSQWKHSKHQKTLSGGRREITDTWADPKTGLEAKCVSIHYTDFPVVEWTVYFTNKGSSPTPILESIRSIDISVRGADGKAVLHHFRGAPAGISDYEPFVDELAVGVPKIVEAVTGLGTDSDLPYFNVEGDAAGIILAVGWPGQWTSTFLKNSDGTLIVKAGQKATHFSLQPGEIARTPLSVVQYYIGDWIHGQNVWRQWMLRHNVPMPGGKPIAPEMAACSSHQFGEMINANTENQKLFVDRYLEEKLPLDFWWMDAGWYINNGSWANTGNWEVDQKRFPGGLRMISDHAHEKGVKTIVWFEPERVSPGTWLYKHSDWLLTNHGNPGGDKLLNLGNPEARTWVTDHIDRLITDDGIDLYRQDYNINPLPYWRAAEAEDRQGMVENKYIQGYLAYWDALRERHPGMLIDSCASGGRRNDLETLRRAVPLLRSDCIMDWIGEQSHTYGIAFWFPFYGTGTRFTDAYSIRSALCPHFTACFDMRDKSLDYESLRKVLNQWKTDLAPNFLGDYYPLTPYSLEKNAWMAFQWNRPEAGVGAIQAFRRQEAESDKALLKLHALKLGSVYAVKDADTGVEREYTAEELSEKGLPVTIGSKPGAAVLIYREVRK